MKALGEEGRACSSFAHCKLQHSPVLFSLLPISFNSGLNSMVSVVLILTLCGVVPLHTWDVTENDRHDILQRWGYYRVKRKSRIEQKFDLVDYITCDDMSKTRKTAFVAIVLYQTSGRFLCMGSIVDRYHVLSAKDCFEKTGAGDLLILVGYFKPYWGKNSQVKKIEKVIRNDYMIALARLKHPISFTDYVKSMKFPASYTKGQKTIDKIFEPPYQIIGMDVDKFDIPGDYLSKEAIYELSDDDLAPFDECKKNYSKLILENDKLFCVGGNTSFCWGAMGGPVVKWMESYFLQIGLVVAENCTFGTVTPFLATRIDVYSDWIKSNSYHDRKPR